jgi:hypothetical protein
MTTFAQQFAGRIIVSLNEMDGRTYYGHGFVIAPPGVTVEQATQHIADAYDRATADNEEWCYDNVFAEITKDGYEHISPDAAWWEPK